VKTSVYVGLQKQGTRRPSVSLHRHAAGLG
jgi:hypothetical protein